MNHEQQTASTCRLQAEYDAVDARLLKYWASSNRYGRHTEQPSYQGMVFSMGLMSALLLFVLRACNILWSYQPNPVVFIF